MARVGAKHGAALVASMLRFGMKCGAFPDAHNPFGFSVFQCLQRLCFLSFPVFFFSQKQSPILGFLFHLFCCGGRGIRKRRLGESSVGRERDGSVDTVDGWETVGNSFGRAPLGGSETEAWTSWTDRKPWEMESTVGETEAWTSWTDGKPWEIGWGELRWEGARRKCAHRGRMGNRGGNSLGRGARRKCGHRGRTGNCGK